MPQPLRSHPDLLAGLVCLVLAVVAAPSPAPAQLPGGGGTGGGGGGEADELRKKLMKAQQGIKMRLELMAAQSAAEEAGTDPESGLQRNLLYDSSDQIGSHQKTKIRQCLNPPQDRLGSYSVAIVEFDDPDYVSPAELGGGTSTPDIVLKKDKYLNKFMAKHAPAPRQEGRPGVRMVFDLGPREWDYALGDGWESPSKVRSHLDDKLAGESLEIDDDHVAEAVCTVVEHVERFLSKTSDKSPSTFFQIRDLQKKIEDLQSRLDGIEPSGVAGLEGRSPDPTLFATPRKRTEDLIGDANLALDHSDVKAGKSKVAEATDLVEELEANYEALKHHAGKSKGAADKVDRRETQLGIRTIEMLPGGQRLRSQLETCRQRADEYRSAFETGAKFDALADVESQFDECLTELERVAGATAGQFRLWVYQLPAVVLALMLGAGTWRWFRKRQRQSTVEYQAESAREEWHRRLPAIQDRLDGLSDKHPEILTEAGSQDNLAPLDETDIERIDLTYALAARAHQILDEADRTVQLEDGPKKVRLEETRRLLEDESSKLTPENTRDDTRLGEGLNRTYTFEHGELLNDLSTLVDEADDRLGSADATKTHW